MESATLFAKRIVNERRAQGLSVYDGGLGENPLSLPKELCQELVLHAEDKGYTPIDGHSELRDTILEHYKTDEYIPDSCVVGNGLKELLFITQLAFDGIIILIAPFWTSYDMQAEILKKPVIILKTKFSEGYKLNIEYIENEMSKYNEPKMLIFNNPTNPTGIVYTPSEVKQIAEACEKYNVTVLADEIYIDLVHTGYNTDSISKYCRY